MLVPDNYYQDGSALARFGFNGMEREDEIAGVGNSYHAMFWMYDNRTARRWNQDPVDMYGQSRYSTFLLNPIKIIDPLGDKPTDREAAAMAADVYNTENGYYIHDEKGKREARDDLNGWRLYNDYDDIDKNIVLTDSKTGFNSAIYRRQIGEKDGKRVYEYAYVTAGTDDWEDCKTDAKNVLGKKDDQFVRSIKNSQIMKTKMGESVDLTFVGHSLGGALASANSYSTGFDAVTFNAASLAKVYKENVSAITKPNIKAYIVEGEFVDVAQSLINQSAEGDKIYLEASTSWGALFLKRVGLLFLGIESGLKHRMEKVIEIMDEEGIK